ncbi:MULTISPECIES: CcdB family protein [unclassified Mesorhizobium]|nr:MULTISPECIES: CcdB family protein [unclassified Mesorhizobium]
MPSDIAPVPGCRLNPTFPIDGKDHVMVTQFMSALTASELPDAKGISPGITTTSSPRSTCCSRVSDRRRLYLSRPSSPARP